jgi:hypothetical protein
VRRSFHLGLAVLVVAGIALGGALLWSGRPSPADAAHQPMVAAPPLRNGTALSRGALSAPPSLSNRLALSSSGLSPPVSRPLPVTTSSGSPSPAEISSSPADVLRGLDDLREQAFARRDAGLLAQVYLPGPLLDEDADLLRRLVPIGCGLLGAHTDFSDVRASAVTAGRWTVWARAQLAPSTLRCGGVAGGHAAGAGPARLRIELSQVAGRYRIASQLPG